MHIVVQMYVQQHDFFIITLNSDSLSSIHSPLYMLLKIVLPSTRSCGTKNRDVKGGVMEGAPMSPPA